jgi:hypothetical protein
MKAKGNTGSYIEFQVITYKKEGSRLQKPCSLKIRNPPNRFKELPTASRRSSS